MITPCVSLPQNWLSALFLHSGKRNIDSAMNIAYFTNNYRPFVGGVPVAIDKLAGGLRGRGHNVIIFAPDYGADSGQQEEADVFRAPALHHFNDTQFALPLTLGPDGYALFSRFQPDIVHVHHPFLLGSTGLHMGREFGLPVIFTYHTQYEKYAHYLPWDTQMVQALAVNLGARFANQCDAVIAPSSDVQQMLLDREVEVPVEVIPTGVDLGFFRQGDPDWLRRHLKIPTGDRILLFVSRLAPEKNIGFILEAFARLNPEKRGYQLVLTGSGDEKEQLERQAAALQVRDRVHFTGTLTGPDLSSTFRGADLFVFASLTETQGMVVLEAMAAGLPVVALEAPGVRDIVTSGYNGFLCTPGDLEAFAASVEKVLSDQSLFEQLRQGALSRAGGLSVEATAAAVEQVYARAQRSPHHERQSRFLILRELGRYGLERFNQSLEFLTGTKNS